jgi:hypothetical protein
MPATPWAIILCKFTDDNSEPFPIQYYKDLFTSADVGSQWNMVKWFHDCTHGNIDVGGSKVFGWFNIPHSVQDYNNQGGNARDSLIKWARDAATQNGVDLSPFFSTLVCTNLWSDVGEAGTGVVAQGTTPTPMRLGQEMGHVYGLHHSRLDGTQIDYTDPWDMMSGFGAYWTSDSEFTSIGPAYNAWNMRYMNWLDESRVWKAASGGYDQTITLRPLPRHDLKGYLAAEIAGGYLVEFREEGGWDAGIPRPAVLVHRFEGGQSYLMKGNSAVPDLTAGDSFGDKIPQGVFAAFQGYNRVDVISIDTHAPSATIRLRYHETKHINGQAIDPMALILSNAAYVIWAEANHPHVPDVADVAQALRGMNADERQIAVARARLLGDYARVVQEAAAKLGG